MKLVTVAAKQHCRPHELQHRPRGSHQPRSRDRVENEQGQQEGAGIARPHHLQRIHVAVEIFRDGIEAGEAYDGAAHQPDASQPIVPTKFRCFVLCDLTGIGFHLAARYRIHRLTRDDGANGEAARTSLQCHLRSDNVSSAGPATVAPRSKARSGPSTVSFVSWRRRMPLHFSITPSELWRQNRRRPTRPSSSMCGAPKPSEPRTRLLPAAILCDHAICRAWTLDRNAGTHRHCLQTRPRTQPDGGGGVARTRHRCAGAGRRL